MARPGSGRQERCRSQLLQSDMTEPARDGIIMYVRQLTTTAGIGRQRPERRICFFWDGVSAASLPGEYTGEPSRKGFFR
jgi:hypothetical protein